MKLLDLQYLQEVNSTIEIDSAYYSKNEDYVYLKELLNVIFNFPEISRLIAMMYHRRCNKNDLNIFEKKFYKVIEALNALAFEYFKDLQKRYRTSKISYSRDNISNYKKSLISLDEEILASLKIDSHDHTYLPSALNLILNNFRNIYAKCAYDELMDSKSKENIKISSIEEYLIDVFTPFDLILNPRFELKAREIGEKCQTLTQSLIIELNEIKENMIDDIKADLKTQLIDQVSSTNRSLANINGAQIKIKALNMASTLLIWIKNITSLENLKIEFGISELSDYKLKDSEKDVLYQLTKIISYNPENKSSELVSKVDDQWKGLANGNEIKIENRDFKSVVSALFSHPTLLVYQIEVKSPSSKYDYNPEDDKVEYLDEESKKQYEDDLNYAKELQKQMDEEDKPYSYSRNKLNNVSDYKPKEDKVEEKNNYSYKASEANKKEQKEAEDKKEESKISEVEQSRIRYHDVKLENDKQWQCKHCTLVNELPDYKCTACFERDDAAFDKYLKMTYQKINLTLQVMEKSNQEDLSDGMKTHQSGHEDIEINNDITTIHSEKDDLKINRDCDSARKHCEICLTTLYIVDTKCNQCKSKESLKKSSNPNPIENIPPSIQIPIEKSLIENEQKDKKEEIKSNEIMQKITAEENKLQNKEEPKIQVSNDKEIHNARANNYLVDSSKSKPVESNLSNQEEQKSEIVEKCMQSLGLSDSQSKANININKIKENKEESKVPQKLRYEWACKHCKGSNIHSFSWNQEADLFCRKCNKRFNPVRYRCITCLKSFTSKNLIDQHKCD